MLVLAVCTAAFVVGYAGVADGRRVTAPRLLVPEMRRMFPGADWDERVRVVRDGNLWTCGMFFLSFFFLSGSGSGLS